MLQLRISSICKAYTYFLISFACFVFPIHSTS